MKNKMLYLGHNYHMKTKSTQFLFELFAQEYDITFVSYDPYRNTYEGLEEAKGVSYDVLLLFQIMPDVAFLKSNFVYRKGVFFPMYDQVVSLQENAWTQYRDFTIINFCRTTHEALKARGYRSHYIQYFPKPKESIEWGNANSAFFWQRLESIDLTLAAKLLSDSKVDHIHLHKSLDPGQKFRDPDDSVKEKIKITTSEWFDDPEDMHRLVQQSSYYIAPRLYEGIGMSFLEAMASGRCVIAPDHPTMNEYITNGVTGFLYSPDNPEPIHVDNLRDIQKNAWEFICKGYANWVNEKQNILKWLTEEEPRPLVTVVTVVYNAVSSGREETFRQSIESVHNQHYPHIEHLIIDGASTDGTLNLIREYAELGWVRCFSEPDHGMYEAMNKGIRMAQGEYIAFLNTDDYFHDSCAVLESVRSLVNSDADFSFAADRLLEETGVCRTVRKPEIGSFLGQMPFCHQTMFTKRSVLLEHGGFDESYKSSADYDLVLRLLLSGCSYVEVERPIVTYRRGGVSESMQERADQEKYRIFQTQYKKYYPETNLAFAKQMAGRICPAKLYHNVLSAVQEPLKCALKKSAKAMDNGDYYRMPDEWLVPIGKEIRDTTATSNSNERVEQLLSVIGEKDVRIGKFKQYFALLDRWLWLKLQNKGIKDYFERRNYQKIAIYGIGEVGNRIYEELCRTSNVCTAYAIDAQEGKMHPALMVYHPESTLPEVDAIVVSVDYQFDEIRTVLSSKCSCPIISIDEVVFDIQ